MRIPKGHHLGRRRPRDFTNPPDTVINGRDSKPLPPDAPDLDLASETSGRVAPSTGGGPVEGETSVDPWTTHGPDGPLFLVDGGSPG